MNLTHRPALDYSLTELAALLTACFEDYFVPFNIDAARFARLLRMDGVDLELSRVALRNDRPIALGLITQRGWSCRLAGMGVIKSERGGGVGKWLVGQLVDAAITRGDRRMMLEVIEQNAPAIALYKSAGFQTVRRLVGYKGEKLKGVADDRLEEIDPSIVARALAIHGPPDLPWQNAPQTFANVGGRFHGFSLDCAKALLIVHPEVAVVQSLVVTPEHRRQGRARQLLQALIAHLDGRVWRVPATFPEEIAPGLFESLGFELESLSQFEMRLPLNGG